MCGINGIHARPTPPADLRERVLAMNQALVHRGPDDGGVWEGSGVVLGHRRLSVLDTTAASHQPMVSADGNCVLVYNGEIFNYRELRADLEAAGCRFRTTGDTEVLLEGYARWGLEVLPRCNGMFAFAIYDRALDTLILARDRLGIKPLYYAQTGRSIAFSSELYPLVRCGLVPAGLNPAAVAAYFMYLYVPGSDTFYEGIHALDPGCTLQYRDGTVRIEPYWQLHYNIDSRWTLDSAAERLDDLLDDSVRIAQRSDVPLGAFLSGGMDSSTVVAVASRARTSPLKTFSIGFENEEANELPYARQVADHFHTNHTEAMLRPDIASLLPELIRHMGQPFADSSMLPMWLVSRLARTRVTVALSGDGGDELFAGYTWAHMNHRVAQYRRIPEPIRRAAAALLRRVPERPLAQRLRRFNEDSFLARRRSFQRRLQCFSPAQCDRLLLPDAAGRWAAQRDCFDQLWDASEGWGAGDQMLYIDTRMYLPGDILAKVDRMSMAHGLEARVPLLDHRIVEFAATLPFSLKYRRGQSKRVLKHLMRDRLPPSILVQRKRGFSLPIHAWMRNELAELFQDTVLSEGARSREYLNGDFVRELWNRHQARQDNYGHHLWAILIFENWLQQV